MPGASPSRLTLIRLSNGHTSTGYTPNSPPCPAPPPAPTGCSTASNPRRPKPDWYPDAVPAKSTNAERWASPAGACSSPGNGPARPLPTTAPTTKPGYAPSCPAPSPTTSTRTRPSPPTRAATPTSSPDPTTPTCHPCRSASCAPSPTGNAAEPHSPEHDPHLHLHNYPTVFRQPRQHHPSNLLPNL